MKSLSMYLAAVLCGAALFVSSQWADAQNPDPGCQLTGSSACGGDDRGQCKPQERFSSETCSGKVVNKCLADNFCASITKGRYNISGTWRSTLGNILVAITQHADSLTVTGGTFHSVPGEFVGPATIQLSANNTTYVGTITAVDPKTQAPNTIKWNNAVIWRR